MLKLQQFQVRSCPASFRRSGSTSCIAISYAGSQLDYKDKLRGSTIDHSGAGKSSKSLLQASRIADSAEPRGAFPWYNLYRRLPSGSSCMEEMWEIREIFALKHWIEKPFKISKLDIVCRHQTFWFGDFRCPVRNISIPARHFLIPDQKVVTFWL